MRRKVASNKMVFREDTPEPQDRTAPPFGSPTGQPPSRDSFERPPRKKLSLIFRDRTFVPDKSSAYPNRFPMPSRYRNQPRANTRISVYLLAKSRQRLPRLFISHLVIQYHLYHITRTGSTIIEQEIIPVNPVLRHGINQQSLE